MYPVYVTPVGSILRLSGRIKPETLETQDFILADGRAFWFWQNRILFKRIGYAFGKKWFWLKWRIPDLRDPNDNVHSIIKIR